MDNSALEHADWELTTYETLRDYQLSFGAVHVRAMVLDEAQMAKTPGTLLTDAVKAMRADFVLAMTGTPIENRMADLRRIMVPFNRVFWEISGISVGCTKKIRNLANCGTLGTDLLQAREAPPEQPNEFVREIHARMPVILPEERHDAWLSGEVGKKRS